jgi:hypothetical protein
VHALVLRPRGVHERLAHSTVRDVAFQRTKSCRHPGILGFRGSIARPAHPLSTLRLSPYELRRMTRGRRGSLLLRRRTLSFLAPCRFIPALLVHQWPCFRAHSGPLVHQSPCFHAHSGLLVHQWPISVAQSGPLVHQSPDRSRCLTILGLLQPGRRLCRSRQECRANQAL